MAILKNLIVNGSSRFLNTAYFQDVSIAGSAALASLSLSGNLSVTGNTTVAGTLGVTGAATFGNVTATGTVVLSKTQDLSGTANSSPALIVGGTATSAHMEFDANEIHAKATGTTVADLYINNQGGKVYLSGNSVYASGSTFVTPTANISTLNATNVNVTNNLRANHYDLQTVAQLGGSFYVSPTVKFPNSGTTLKVEKSGSTLTLTITDSSITSTTMAGVVWAANSHVKVSGTINGVVTGTMDGTVSSINTSSHFITLSVSGENSASVVAGTYSASQFSNLTVMIYQRRDGSNDYRVGIWMNCYDVANSSSTIRIYGGSDANPNVMLGNLTSAGLGTVNNLTPTGWGLFAQNAFLHGKVVANGGLIGNWTIGTTGMYYNSDAPSSTSITMIPGGTAASTTSIGGSSGSKQWIFTGKNLFGIDTTGKLYASSAEISGKITATSGAIGGFDITSTAIKTKDVAVTSNADNSISLSSSDFTRTINSTSRAGLRFAIGDKFGVTGDGTIYAGSANISGTLTAGNGSKIGDLTIANGKLSVPAANITGTLSADHIDASSLSIGQSQVTGLSTALTNAQNTANAALSQSVEYIVGTQTAATGSWTGVTTDTELVAGKTIAYKLPYAGSGNATLNLTLAGGGTTGAKPVYTNTTRVTTHFGANSVINMTYDGDNWRANSIPNTNNYDRVLHNNRIKAAAAVTAGHIIVGTSSGYKQIAASVVFDMSYPILYAGSKIDSGGYSTGAYRQMPSVVFSNNGAIQGFAIDKTIYLKGSLSGSVFTIASSNFMTCTIPNQIDNYYYIPLGILANNATSSNPIGFFASSDKLYAYINGAFQPVDMAARRYITDISNTGIKLSYVSNPSNYLKITGDGVSIYKDIDGTSTQIANYASSITLGQIANGVTRMQIDNDSLDVISRDNNGVDTTIATFGQTARIGSESGRNITINENGLTFNNSNSRAFYIGVESRVAGKSYLSETIVFHKSSGSMTQDNKTYYLLTTVPTDRTVTEVGWLYLDEGDGEEVLHAADDFHIDDWIINDGKLWINDDYIDDYDGRSFNYIYSATVSSIVDPYCVIGTYKYSSTNIAGSMSFAQGKDCLATGQTSTAIGYSTTSKGVASLASGNQSKAQGDYSFAGGFMSTASGENSFAYGYKATASGKYSTAYGYETTASGGYSTAFGYYTKANRSGQTAIGTFNVADTIPSSAVHPNGTSYGNYAFIIGNGTDNNNRSNALTVDWKGNVVASGSVADADGPLGVKVAIHKFTIAVSTSGTGSGSFTLSTAEASGYLTTVITEVWPQSTWTNANANVSRVERSGNNINVHLSSMSAQTYNISAEVLYRG